MNKLPPCGGRGDSHIKRTGVLVVNFEISPKSYQDPVLWAWLKMFFTPKMFQFRDEIKSQLIFKYFLSYCFGSIPWKVPQSSHCGSFEAQHPEREQNRFFNPLKERWALPKMGLPNHPWAGKIALLARLHLLKSKRPWRPRQLLHHEGIIPKVIPRSQVIFLLLKKISGQLEIENVVT